MGQARELDRILEANGFDGDLARSILRDHSIARVMVQTAQAYVTRSEAREEKPETEVRCASYYSRIAQAKTLWNKGFGRAFDSFDAYLATIPDVPEELRPHDERFQYLILVDARLGLKKSCELAGGKSHEDEQSLRHFGPARTSEVYWMRCLSGRCNRGKSARRCYIRCSEECPGGMGLTAIEGVALYIQNPDVIEGYYINLIASHTHVGSNVAVLGRWRDGLSLSYRNEYDEHPDFGSAYRRK